jgi:ABC-2 type transport system permease protein
MSALKSLRYYTLVQRELQEYRVSLIVTPLVIALVLSLLMLGSVLVAKRITAMGDVFLEMVMMEEFDIEPVITIDFDEDPAPGEVVIAPDVEAVDENEWDFGREWRFKPTQREPSSEFESTELGSLNPLLNVIHSFMLLVLILVTVNYLLACLYSDRKDRSILFWKSMPVSEWEEVLARLAIALVVAPAVFIAVSLLLQTVFILLAMLMVWRMEMDPYATILGNLNLGDLLLQQIGGWVLTALWVAPVYGWLMLASAWARRSPFMVAVAPVLGLMLLEGILLGTDRVLNAVSNHVPHYVGGHSAGGFYLDGRFWAGLDYISLLSGLVFAALTIAGAVYLRRYRFDV